MEDIGFILERRDREREREREGGREGGREGRRGGGRVGERILDVKKIEPLTVFAKTCKLRDCTSK